MDYVKLVNLDLSKFDDPVGRQELARELYEAATGYGFLTLTNHGISDEVYQRQMRTLLNMAYIAKLRVDIIMRKNLGYVNRVGYI